MTMFNFDLSQDIETFILTHPYCKEYDVIQYLQKIGRLSKDCLSNSLSLFRCHFLIFNALYRLQIKTSIHQQYALSISSLEIITKVYKQDDDKLKSHNQTLTQHDPLGLFYLDTRHLLSTTESDIQQLLEHFWRYYFNDTQKQNALSVLGLDEPVDFKTIKLQYRRLAMQHHPDRGGDADILVQIHQAMQCLQHYYP
jgi:hypothetical protein